MKSLLLWMAALDAEYGPLKSIPIQFLRVWEVSHRQCIYLDEADKRKVLFQTTYSTRLFGQGKPWICMKRISRQLPWIMFNAPCRHSLCNLRWHIAHCFVLKLAIHRIKLYVAPYLASELTLLIPCKEMQCLVLRIPSIFTIAYVIKLTCSALSSKLLHLCNWPLTSRTFTMAVDNITCVSQRCFKEQYYACIGATFDGCRFVRPSLLFGCIGIMLLMYPSVMQLRQYRDWHVLAVWPCRRQL